ncbi:MAG: hypothetical protein ACD_2C00185G0007 [uncultured bacterium (gcode 4)]|uniref:Prepilin-type N-terminal cleavage/methylation domain-containing protein n=1 Tax=uncultured bacterium (gcode 4) TaxID=1234023 RepID=K2G4W8_9BACT|nr:MAG: hypothetical protein ACD_2C00185G0007 [uncultured bacterium (gcode 4)]
MIDEIIIKNRLHIFIFYNFFIMNMRKHTTKGFTLVELIVVIVILAILATIAFLSFSSQSASARDSKRKTDLSNIASKVNIGAANGSALTSFVSGTSSKVTNVVLAGTWSPASYEAGEINFSQLGVNAEDFKDPFTKTSYKMGATSLVGWAFQLASRLENDDNGNTTTSGAFLVGNFSARAASTTASGTSDSTTTAGTVTLTSNIGLFKTWDYVQADSAAICKVDSVSADMAKIKLSGCTANLSSSVANYHVALSESDGLIVSKENTNSWVVAGGGTTPY